MKDLWLINDERLTINDERYEEIWFDDIGHRLDVRGLPG